MKTIKYIITTAILLLAFAEFAHGQSLEVGNTQRYRNIRDFEHDPAPLIGPWRASSGDMTYELSFVIDTVNSNNISYVGDPLPHTDKNYKRLVGTMIYKRNGTIIRTLSPQSHPEYMSIFGYVGGTDYLAINFCDYEHDALGSVILRVVEGSQNKKATWRLLQDFGEGDFDIPHDLIFEKFIPFITPSNPGVPTLGGGSPFRP